MCSLRHRACREMRQEQCNEVSSACWYQCGGGGWIPRYGSCGPGLKYLWGCAEGWVWPPAAALGQRGGGGVGARNFEFMHRVAKWLSDISANIGWTFPGPRSRLLFRLSSPCTLEIIQGGFCKGFLRVIEFLLLQKSMKSCTVWKRRGKIQQSHRVLYSQTQTLDLPQQETALFFHYLTTYSGPEERLVRERTATVVFQTSVLCTEERFQSCCEIVRLGSSGSTPWWPKTKQTKNSQTQISSTWAMPQCGFVEMDLQGRNK